jgi:hypothetical protein
MPRPVNVLIVEDNEDDAQLVKRELQKKASRRKFRAWTADRSCVPR